MSKALRAAWLTGPSPIMEAKRSLCSLMRERKVTIKAKMRLAIEALSSDCGRLRSTWCLFILIIKLVWKQVATSRRPRKC